MELLETTPLEFYALGIEALADELNPDEIKRFLHQCKPGTGDYTAERHNWLKDEPLDAIVDSIEQARLEWQAAEHAIASRFAASQSEMRHMTDGEIYEIGAQVLTDSLGAAGSIRFYLHHFKHGNPGDSAAASSHVPAREKRARVTSGQQAPAAPPTPWPQEVAGPEQLPASPTKP